MKHRICHDLTIELARKATARALESYRDQFPEVKPEGRWITDDTAIVAFTVAGSRLEGQIDVQASGIDIDLEVPFLFRPFRRQAVAIIEAEIQVWLDKAREGELD